MMPGPLQLGLILIIVIVIFGAKRLKNIGSDLGGAVKGFKSAVKDDAEESTAQLEEAQDETESAVSRDNDENKV